MSDTTIIGDPRQGDSQKSDPQKSDPQKSDSQKGDPARPDRRAELIEATIVAIATHGLSRTTLATVARVAGQSPSIVNFYFKTKDALLLATLKAVADAFEAGWRRALASAGDDPAARLAALVEASLDAENCDPKRVAVWDAFWGETKARADYLKICGASDDAFQDTVVDLCRELAIDTPGADGAALGVALYHLLSGLPQGALADPRGFDRGAALATARAFLASVFPGHFAPAPAPSVAVDQGRRTLAAWTYRDEELVALEKEHIFRRNWLFAGHVTEVAGPGDYLTFEAFDERIVVIRGHDDRLRAFHNVCRHRAARVVAGQSGTCRDAMICRYHGWTYGLDGSLRSVPAEASFGGLDKAALSLPEVALEVWQGMIFIRLGGSGPSVAERMAPMADDIAPYRIAEMKLCRAPWRTTIEANWKSVIDNDSEGYHIPTGHPGLRRLLGKSYRDETLPGGAARSIGELRARRSPAWSEGLYQSLLPEVAHLPPDRRRAWLYSGLFPTFSLCLYPDLMEYIQVFPISARRALVEGRAYALPDDRREMRAARWLNERINRQVWREDETLVAWADGGLRSSSYRGGVLSDLETHVAGFHDGLRAALPVAALDTPPPPGRLAAVNRMLAANG